MTLEQKQKQIAERLLLIEDPQERLSALMSRAKKWPVPPPEKLVDEYRIHGCQSRVWLECEAVENLGYFRMECDAPMVKGLVALMCEIYHTAPLEEILVAEPTLFDAVGFTRMISPTRLNGLAAVRARIRQFAASKACK